MTSLRCTLIWLQPQAVQVTLRNGNLGAIGMNALKDGVTVFACGYKFAVCA